jgi:hypothetical protein
MTATWSPDLASEPDRLAVHGGGGRLASALEHEPEAEQGIDPVACPCRELDLGPGQDFGLGGVVRVPGPEEELGARRHEPQRAPPVGRADVAEQRLTLVAHPERRSEVSRLAEQLRGEEHEPYLLGRRRRHHLQDEVALADRHVKVAGHRARLGPDAGECVCGGSRELR